MENIWMWIRNYHDTIIFGLTIAAAVLTLISLLLLINSFRLSRRIKAYESGSLNKTLEDKVAELEKELQIQKNELKEEKRQRLRFASKEKKAVKKVKLIKYNAFETQGGNVSYALALLDEENNGIILNSIHSTDFSFSYAKEVKRGEVAQVMSKEERQVLSDAVNL